MWNYTSVDETFHGLCSSDFWDYNITWNSPTPDFTICFEKTVLVWIPCLFLWLFTPVEIAYLRRKPRKSFRIPLSLYNISKLVAIGVLAVTALLEITGYIFATGPRHPVDIYSPMIKLLSFCLFLNLTYANIRCSTRSSGILFVFSLLLALCGFPQFRTEFKSRLDLNQGITNFITYILYYPAVWVVLLLNCFADTTPAAKNSSGEKNASPRKEASFLSRMFFAWVDELTWRGYKNPLTENDVWNLDNEMQTAQIAKKFEARWQVARKRLRKTGVVDIHAHENEKLLQNGDVPMKGVSDSKRETEKASIFRPLCEVFGPYFLIGLLSRTLYSCLAFASSVILNLILDFVVKEKEFVWRGFLYVFLLLTVAILELVFITHANFVLGRIGLQIRTALISLIYKKAMNISNGTRKKFTVGEIVNLMAVDAERSYVILLYYLPALVLCPLEICVALYCLWYILGPCIIAGITVFLLLVAVNGVITPKIQKLQTKQMKHKDERVRLTNEILSGIKVLKLYAWEPSFEKLITRIRDKEIRILKRIAYLQTWFSFMAMCIPSVITLVTFGTYVLLSEENVLDPKITFVSLSLLNIVKFPIYLFPEVISGIIKGFVAVKRIDRFLNSEDLDPNAVSHEPRDEPVVIENGEFSWEGYNGPTLLSDINVAVKSCSLVAVVGSVGSGKSSFLSAILGEMYKKSGIVNTTGKLAYVPQQAWIRNATVEHNITFGETKITPYYDTVLEACALLPDLEILPGGDQTEIGEKGANMSGGQKQRISLARAVYSNADTYLLDDPLSAVDSHVGEHIFEKVIGPNGLLKNKTRIFVTHNMKYLPQTDHIIVLKNGIMSECGTYDELLKRGGDFSSFLSTYATNEENTHEEATDNTRKITNRIYHERKIPVSSEVNKKKVEVVASTLIEKERMEVGNVKWKVYAYYLRAFGPFIITVIILANVFCQIFSVSTYYWLSAWSSDSENSKKREKQYMYVGIYALFGAGQAISVATLAVVLAIGSLKAAKFIHNHLLKSMFHWPIGVFDRIPSGRLLNRFSSDVDALDNILPTEILELLKDTATVIATLFVFSYNTPMFVCVLLPVAAAYCVFQRLYVATSKQIRRMESVSKSPIYTHFNDTVTGSISLRAYGLQTKFIEASYKKIDSNLQNSFANFVLDRWFVSRLDLLGVVIIFSAAMFAMLNRNSIGPALVGLSITFAVQVNIYFSWWIRHVCWVETNIVAVERIEEYVSDIEHEAPWTLSSDKENVPTNWPQKGEIAFENFQARYRKDLEPVLKGISFNVNGGEKIGIAGRTGAGKSSLTLSLFRLIESAGGRIIIDNIDISKIGLHALRSRLTIIPQDPVLFSGTLRMNLDPAEEYTDESIWSALELANLKTHVQNLDCRLHYKIDESGSNFSVGQRQLICLARALLRKTKLLILDEATAAVDFETDDLIQRAIKKEFHDCTVLTIAHRLNTISDCDKIMVLDRGHIVESFLEPKW